MGELINGRTPEEIKRILRWINFDCADHECDSCPNEDICSLQNGNEEVLAKNALDLIERLEAERDAALTKVPKWISVKERLPEAYQCVIAHVRHTEKWRNNAKPEEQWHVVEEDCWLGDGWECNADTDIHEVTHWMPLPEPPEEYAHG